MFTCTYWRCKKVIHTDPIIRDAKPWCNEICWKASCREIMLAKPPKASEKELFTRKEVFV